MGAVRTMEDFIRQRMVVDGSRRMSITLRSDGRFEASWVHRDGKTATCDVADDPADALWNSLVPFTMRRRLQSGREVVIEGTVHGVEPVEVADDLNALLGGSPTTVAPVLTHADDLEDLLG